VESALATLLEHFPQKSVGETVPGELIWIPFCGGVALCINIEAAHGGLVRLGILKGNDIDRPSYFCSAAALWCISYGTDWVIEPIFGDESFSAEEGGRQTTLYLANGAAALRFDRVSESSELDYLYVDLTRGSLVDIGGYAVPVERWKIWACEADRNSFGNGPVVTFGE
jgi:hypothetical protein